MEKRKNIPELRFPEFDGEWQGVALGEICSDIMYGLNAAAKEYDGVHKYLRITDIDDESREFYPNPLSSPSGRISEEYKLKKGDIVFARTGASVGKSYLYRETDGNVYFAGFLIKFSVKDGNPYFVFTQTLRNEYKKWVKVMSMRSGQPGINAEEYKSLTFFIPTLSEQQKIASFFTVIDRKISQLKQKKTLLEQYKKGVMQKIFSQQPDEGGSQTPLKNKQSCEQIRFKDDNGREFPKWERKKLGDVADRMVNKNNEGNTNVLTISAQNGLVSQLDFFNKSVSSKNVTGYYLLTKDDFAYNKSYSNGYPMGAIKRLKLYDNGVVSTLYICFSFTRAVNLLYMEQYFESGTHNRQIEKVAQEGARNHGLLNIGVGDFFSTEMILPTLPEQTKIANFLSAIDTKINHTQTQIENAELWKKGLLQKMFV